MQSGIDANRIGLICRVLFVLSNFFIGFVMALINNHTPTMQWFLKMEYNATSTGPRLNIPLLEMFAVLLWDDRQLWVLPLWWNIPTGDMEYMHALPYFEPDKGKMISLHSQHGLLVRCQWVKMPWRMGDQQTESTSSRQTGKNHGLTTPTSSGSRTEKCNWNIDIITQKIPLYQCSFLGLN